jgi:hypothetical protein
LAWDLRARANITRKATVAEFLGSLMSPAAFIKFEEQCAIQRATICSFLGKEETSVKPLLGYIVFFTHFIQVCEYTPNRQQLLDMFQRGAAVITQERQEGIDLIIPIYCGDHEDDEPLKARNMSFILISVKNRRKNEKLAEWKSAISPRKVGVISEDEVVSLPYISMVINLGCSESDFQIFQLPKKYSLQDNLK